MFMNNFTKSAGNAYWHAITNLTCCRVDLKKMQLFKTFLVLMLFAFSSTSMFAQNRTTFYEVCIDDRPQGLTTEQALALFPDADTIECKFGEGEASTDGFIGVDVSEELQGTDCGWVTIYTYYLLCSEDETFEYDKDTIIAEQKIIYEGGDVTPPVLVVPADETVECDSIPSLGTPTATDNCDDDVEIRYDGEQRTDGDCDNSYTLTRTWTAIDNCNPENNVTLTQTITVIDTTAPRLNKGAKLPEGETGLDMCYEPNMPNLGPTSEYIKSMYTDNCGEVVVQMERLFKGTDCAWKGFINFYITDACGNEADIVSLYYNGSDSTAPVFDETPADITVSCIDLIPANHKLPWKDNCSVSDPKEKGLAIEDRSNLGEACEGGSMTRTWTATDDCGNSVSHTQTITVTPAPPVTFDQLDDLEISCEDLDGFVAGSLGYSNGGDGACDINGSVDGVAEDFKENCGSFTVTYTYNDTCNSIQYIQTITVIDDVKPTLIIPADETVECDAVPAVGDASATDNCDNDVLIKYDGESRTDGNCADSYTLTRTWSAEDNCGNITTLSQTITVVDTTAPELTIPADETVECDAVPAVGVASATDNCDSDVTVEFLEEKQEPGNCDDSYTLIRIWRATDNCGNETIKSQQITVVDTTAPVLTIPADETAECDAVPNVGDASASDNCDANVDVKFDGEYRKDGDCADSYILERTWTATDNCGNATTLTQIITVVDTTAPELTIPADETVECDAVPQAGDTSASDNCDADVDVTYDGEVRTDGNCANSYTLTRTWTATDNCGNATSKSQVITVVDTTDPVISVPADVTVECDDVPDNGVATADDNCDDDVKVDFLKEERIDGDCENSYKLVRIWIAEDDCGNTVTGSQTITVVDTTAPELTIPDDARAECHEVPAVGDASATDNCDANVTVTYDGEQREDGDCADNYTLIRTWTAEDNCGNKTTKSQIITIYDETPPELTIPADETVECDAVPTVGDASATDLCDDDVDVKFDGEYRKDGECLDSYSIERTWTATDNCGNETTLTQIITVVDTTAPVLTIPADETAECDAVPQVGQASASDNCDANVDVTYDGEVRTDGDCDNSYTLTRTWTATDNCDNATTLSQTITIVDTTAPVLEIPADETVECDSIPDVGDAYARDNCDDDVDVKFDGEYRKDGDCLDSYFIERTWTATDNCGNATTLTQIITVVDTTAPVITVPADEAADCAAVPAPGNASGVDNCDTDVEIRYDGEVRTDGDCPGNYTLVRTWTAIDNCGNESSDSQTITVTDTTAPVQIADIPESINEINGCASQAPTALTEGEFALLFKDDCSNVVVELFSSTVGNDCGWSIIHIYTVSDDCGNLLGDFKVYYSGEDGVAPELVGVSADMLIDCTDDIPAPAVVTATDNCDTDVKPEFSEDTVRYDCAGNYDIVRTWTATDDCGNPVSATQTIQVRDNDAPELTGVLPEGSNENDLCAPDTADELAALGVLTEDEFALLYTDNCSGVNVDREINLDGDDCKWIMWVRYDVYDDCGNDTTIKLWYHGADMSAPVITKADDDGAECDGTNDAFNAWLANNGGHTAIDCSGVTWSNNYVPPTGVVLPANDCETSVTVTFTATDACGHASNTISTFTVVDTTAPEFVDCKDDEMEIDFDPINGPGDKAGFTMLGENGGNFYYVSNSTMTGADAHADALLNGGYAVTINDATEEGWVKAAVAGVIGDLPYWIGLTDAAVENTFVWQDGDPSTYRNWDGGEPNSAGDEDYVEGNSPYSASSNWNDEKATSVRHYVLEVKGLSLTDELAYTDACAGNDVTTDFNDVTSSVSIPYFIDLDTDCWSAYYTLDAQPDANGFPTWTGYFPPNPTGDYRIAYNHNLGQWEETEDGFAIFWQQTLNTVPSCDISDWDVIPNLSCDPNTASYTCSAEGITNNTLERTFTATDGCNEETCTVTYTWTTGDELIPVNPNDGSASRSTFMLQRGAEISAAANIGDTDKGIELDFMAYPVPFDKDVNVKFNFEFDTDVTINVHDTRGLLVKSLSLSNVRAGSEISKAFDLSRAGDQIFYISVITNKGSVTKKVVSSNMKF